jgi:hypothetical protein
MHHHGCDLVNDVRTKIRDAGPEFTLPGLKTCENRNYFSLELTEQEARVRRQAVRSSLGTTCPDEPRAIDGV